MLKSVLSTLDGVQEEFKSLYVQDGDVFKLQVEGLVTESDVSGLKSALDKERDRRRAVVEELNSSKLTQGIVAEDVKELEKLRQAEKDREMKAAEDAGEYAKVRQAMVEKHALEMAAVNRDLASEKGARISQDLTTEAMIHINKHGGVPEYVLPVVEKITDWRDVNGVKMHAVLDENGDTKYGDDGKPMTVGSYIEFMSTDKTYGKAFSPIGNKGTESPTSRRRSFADADPSNLSSDEKIQQGLELREQK